MLLKMLKKYLLLITMVIASGLQVGCSGNDDSSGENGVTISGTLNDSSSLALSKVSKSSALSIADYEIYCVTFQEEPYSAKSEIASNGRFSLEMPANTPFGCFINHVATQVPVATIAIAGDGEGFGDNASTALQLRGDADFGDLNLDLERAQVLVARERIEDVIDDQTESQLDPREIGGNTYAMTCLPSGNQYLDDTCRSMLEEDQGSVYLRTMQGTRNGEAVNGIGVWASEQAFSDCGSIDLMDSTVADIAANDNILFDIDGLVSGANFTTGSSCPLRDAGAPVSHENLENYFAAGELVADGQGWTLYARDRHQANAGCEIEHTTVVHFSGDDAQEMHGQFMTSDQNIELNNGMGDCSHLDQEPPKSFTIRFTQQ